MERKTVRLILISAVVMTFLTLLAVGIRAKSGCPTYVDCPMHGQNSNMTGHTKYANGHQWAEFICRAEAQAHTFWVQCD
jgi:hypothetical protein